MEITRHFKPICLYQPRSSTVTCSSNHCSLSNMQITIVMKMTLWALHEYFIHHFVVSFSTFSLHIVAGTGNSSFGKHRSKPGELCVCRSHSDQEPADRVSAEIRAKRPGTGKTRRFTLNQDDEWLGLGGKGGHLRLEVNTTVLVLFHCNCWLQHFFPWLILAAKVFSNRLFNFCLILFPLWCRCIGWLCVAARTPSQSVYASSWLSSFRILKSTGRPVFPTCAPATSPFRHPAASLFLSTIKNL